MTLDPKPIKSPARTKGQGGGGQPAMTQKSLLSFFKAPPTLARSDSSLTDESSEAGAGAASLPKTPVRTHHHNGNGHRGSSLQDSPPPPLPLFSTDEAVLRNPKRKNVDLDEDPQSPLPQETRSVKKFAAAVGRLSLNTAPVPPPKLQLEEPDQEDEDLSLGSRRSVRSPLHSFFFMCTSHPSLFGSRPSWMNNMA